MSKERLERMMQYYSSMESAPLEIQEDMRWPLNYAKEQAERVQEFEERLNALITLKKSDANAMGVLMEQNKRYREAIEIALHYVESVYDLGSITIASLLKEILESEK